MTRASSATRRKESKAEPHVSGASLLRRLATVTVTLLLLGGCGGPNILNEARQAYDRGQWEDALAQLRVGMEHDPQNTTLRVAYLTLRERAVNLLLQQQSAVTGSNAAGERTRLLRRVLAIDPGNQRAMGELEQISRDGRTAKLLLDAQFAFDGKKQDVALAKVRSVLGDDPANPDARALLKAILEKTASPTVDPGLTQALQTKVTIQFKDAMLKQVFEVLSRTSEINFVLDKDIKGDQRTSVFLKDVPVKDALDVLLLSNQLEQRVVNRNAILIYPNNPAKQKDYQALSVHTFFLANVDVEQMANTLKTILKAQNLVVDKAQSMIVMRDTPDAIAMAEKIVALEDLATPETMLEVEVLEVTRNRLQDLGITYPTTVSLVPLASTSGGTVTLRDLIHSTAATTGATIAPLSLSATGTDSDVQLLANPRIRVKNREAAKILIGDRVPNITSTSTSTGFVSENITYLDVGLKLEVTPVISIDNEVSMKISLEVSSVANQTTTSSGTVAYEIGTRTVSTNLRLRDGENQVLAGLINNQDSRSVSKIAGLGDLPLLGHLFSDHNDTRNKTEIVLSITPHIIRNPLRPEARLTDFASGTESSLRSGGETAGLSPMTSTPASTASAQTGAMTRPGASGDAAAGTTGMAAAAAGNATGAAGGTGTASDGGAAPAATVAGLTWSGPTSSTVGTSMQQQLLLGTTQAISGISLVLGYDPTALSVTAVTEGTAMNRDGTATTFTQRVDPLTGQIYLSDSRAGTATAGAVGQATLASLTVKALKAGASTELTVLSVTPVGFGGAAPSLPTTTQSIAVKAAQ